MIAFESFTPKYLPLLYQWMQKPFWNEGKLWVVLRDKPIGFIQLNDTPDALIARMDFYNSDKERGAEVLKLFLQSHIFPNFEACIAILPKENRQAIKSYARAGFSTLSEGGEEITLIARKEAQFNPLILFASSRSEGNTLRAIKAVIKERKVPLVDLSGLNISYFDYTHTNAHDGFIPLAEKMLLHNPLILATPVYWYTMSAQMKTFIDRWSDLLAIRKDIGYRLACKDLYVITSYGEDIPRGFEEAFIQTCEYLDMHYKGCLYFYGGEEIEKSAKNTHSADLFELAIFEGISANKC